MDGGRHSNGDKSFPHFLTFISNCLIAIIALLITLIFYKASDYGLMLDRVCFFSSADPYLKYLHVRYNLEIQFLVVCLIYTSRRLTDVMIMISYCKHEPDDLEALELVSFLASLVASTIIVFFSVKHVMLIGW